MFRPRHAYRWPKRYRGEAKGCPVFNNLNDIDSTMVEQHDECLQCLARLKNRTDLYKTLSDNQKPSNNIIKSLQRLSSSATNNRLKMCLQFLIIKVNEKSIATIELQGPKLKLSDDKIRKILKRPVTFDDLSMDDSLDNEMFTEDIIMNHNHNHQHHHQAHQHLNCSSSSSGCSPNLHKPNSTDRVVASCDQDQTKQIGLNPNNIVTHTFQAPAKFVNNLDLPSDLPQQQEPSPISTPAPIKDLINCTICGIKDKPTNVTKIFGQYSCVLCSKFFMSFLKRPQQLFCAQDGDCLMTFDSRCRACWIKICLQKFNIEDEHRKIGQKYSPKLLSSPNVSLITIDTS